MEKIIVFDEYECWYTSEVIAYTELTNQEVIAIIDVNNKKYLEDVCGVPVKSLNEIDVSAKAICSLQEQRRADIIEKYIPKEMKFTNVIHPSVHIPKFVELGKGIIIGPNVSIGNRTKIGNHVIINRGSTIGHDVVIGDFVTISPGVNIGGRVRLREFVYIGMGANIFPCVFVGPKSIVGAGSVVTKNVPAKVKTFGIPSRIK
jgi:sugar O-acyltransferase (sialic acid O-acetyltransferase NeuD family)